MEDKTIEKVDFSIEELETNYYECTFDKCNFSDKPIGRVIFEKCTFKECNLSLVKTSNTSWLDIGEQDIQPVIPLGWMSCSPIAK